MDQQNQQEIHEAVDDSILFQESNLIGRRQPQQQRSRIHAQSITNSLRDDSHNRFDDIFSNQQSSVISNTQLLSLYKQDDSFSNLRFEESAIMNSQSSFRQDVQGHFSRSMQASSFIDQLSQSQHQQQQQQQPNRRYLQAEHSSQSFRQSHEASRERSRNSSVYSHSRQQHQRFQSHEASRERSIDYNAHNLSGQQPQRVYQYSNEENFQHQQQLSEHDIEFLLNELDQQDNQRQQPAQNNNAVNRPEELLENQIDYLNEYLSQIDNNQEDQKITELRSQFLFVCLECPRGFNDQGKFCEHMTEKRFALALHLKIANYLCKICNQKAFQQKRHFFNHLVSCYCVQNRIQLSSQQLLKIKVAAQLKNAHKYDFQNGLKKLNVE